MTTRIAIVGMGCSGTLSLRFLANDLHANDPVEILIYEKAREIGPGLPYGRQFNDEQFIMNMETSSLGADVNNPREFVDWLAKKHSHVSQRPYVQRIYMGQYLKEMVRSSLAKLKEKKIKFYKINSEVNDIRSSRDGYIIKSTLGKKQVNNVILALGHMRRKNQFLGQPGYIANPYDELDTLKNISSSSSIAILGTKLTAIDFSMLLSKSGHNNVTMLSNSGRLPLVQGVYSNKPIATSYKPRTIDSLQGFFDLLVKDANHHQVIDELKSFIPYQNQKELLAQELKKSDSIRPWQKLLDQTKHFIDQFWHDLSSEEKNIFLEKHNSIWMSCRHPMPAYNAKKIYDMLQSNVLNVERSTDSKILFMNKSAQFKIQLQDKTYKYFDYLVDARGTPKNIKNIDSNLIENLLKRNIIKPGEFGGVDIEFNTQRVRGQQGMFTIGMLTHGNKFYVSAIEQISRQAKMVASELLKEIQEVCYV